MHCVTNTNPYLNIIIEVILKCITTTTELAKISFSNGELAGLFLLPKYCIKLSDCICKCLHTHFYLWSQVHGTGHDWRALNTIYYHPQNISSIWVQRPWSRVLAGLNSLTVSLGLAETKMISMTPYTSSVSVGNRILYP